jgi:hypothetical protein
MVARAMHRAPSRGLRGAPARGLCGALARAAWLQRPLQPRRARGMDLRRVVVAVGPVAGRECWRSDGLDRRVELLHVFAPASTGAGSRAGITSARAAAAAERAWITIRMQNLKGLRRRANSGKKI